MGALEYFRTIDVFQDDNLSPSNHSQGKSSKFTDFRISVCMCICMGF